MYEHIVIISGSAPLDAHVVEAIPDDTILLAVDGGLDHALAAGLLPSHLIGDCDSVSTAGLAWADEHATIARFPPDKDLTDTELALAFAADMDPARLTLVGGGNRLDHGLAAIGALGHNLLASVPRIDGWWDGQHLDVVHGPGHLDLHLVPSTTLSLLALHGTCAGVTITGVRWPLHDAELAPLVGWGVSNKVQSGDGESGIVPVHLSTGVLTIFDTPSVAPTSPAIPPHSAITPSSTVPPARNR